MDDEALGSDSEVHMSRYAMNSHPSGPSRAHSTVPSLTPISKTPYTTNHHHPNDLQGGFTLGDRKGSVGASPQPAWAKSIRTASVTSQNVDGGDRDGQSQVASRRQTATSQLQRQMTRLKRPENGALATAAGGGGAATAGLVRSMSNASGNGGGGATSPQMNGAGAPMVRSSSRSSSRPSSVCLCVYVWLVVCVLSSGRPLWSCAGRRRSLLLVVALLLLTPAVEHRRDQRAATMRVRLPVVGMSAALPLLLLVAAFSFACLSVAGRSAPQCVDRQFAQSLAMPIDHFNATDARTFPLRVRWCSEYYNPTSANQPAVLLVVVGPETTLSDTVIDRDAIYSSFAPGFNNVVVLYTEHRYYGQSLPFGNGSFTPSALQYLTIDQTLHDNAAAITWLIQTHMAQSSAVSTITFGGSYGGFLSASMRITFPSLVTAALASCTVPWMASPNVPDMGNRWNDLLSDGFAQWTPNPTTDDATATPADEEQRADRRAAQGQCSSLIQAAMEEFVGDFKIGNLSAIESGLGLCGPALQSTDLWPLHEYVMKGFGYMSLFNYPISDVFCDPWPLSAFCQRAVDGGLASYGLLSLQLQMTYNTSGTLAGVCLPWDAQSTVLPATFCTRPKPGSDGAEEQEEEARPVERRSAFPLAPRAASDFALSGADTDAAAWAWTSCTEFIYPAGGGIGIFGLGFTWSESVIQQNCAGVTGSPSSWHPRGGLLDPSGVPPPSWTNLVFSYADTDPNRGWTPTTNQTSSILVVELPGQGHCADMIHFATGTTPELTAARQQELAMLQAMLQATPSDRRDLEASRAIALE